jgi:hypothetical protein
MLVGDGMIRRQPQPALLGICQESRRMALKFYELWNVFQRARNCRQPQMEWNISIIRSYQPVPKASRIFEI